MKFKDIRYKLASFILGGLIIDDLDMQAEKMKWVKEQLDFGNTVSMGFSVVEPIKKRIIK